ncbi:MAG: T9SS type A sorting domain-containing protein [Saprospiraceae bacterium]|nr:T9SS type A sorting domain-containing protein [Saprospiraceae bacterium]
MGFLRFFIYLLIFSSISVNLTAQSGYRLVKVLKDRNQTETLNPCFLPKLIDSSSNGKITLNFVSSGKYELFYEPDSNFIGSDTVIVEARTTNDQSYKLVWYSFIFCYVNSYLETRQDYYLIDKNAGSTTVFPLLNDSTSIQGSDNIKITQIVNAHRLESVSFTDSTVSFTPMTDSVGKSTITYRVCDILGLCETNQIFINVVDPASATNDTILISTAENYSVTMALTLNNLNLTQNPKKGKVTIQGPSFKYQPHKNIFGKDTFLLGGSGYTTVVYVEIFDLPPSNSIIQEDKFITPVNQELSFDVSNNDVGPIVSKYPILIHDTVGLKGTLERLDTKGKFRFTPQTDYKGVQTFRYKVCPQGICEYATVVLLIGDCEPMTDHTYQFKTKRNTPLLLSYNIPVDAYDFSSSNPRISFYPGWDTIVVNYNNGCTSTIIGYNSLIYTPLLNTIGTETIEIEYCVNSNGRCVTAELNIETEYEQKNCIRQCVGDCVWPGDVDFNGRVDMNDLLHVAYQMGKEGESRIFTGNEFRSHKADDWDEDLANSSIDLKHADTDGNGIINEEDLNAIDANFYKEHSLIPDLVLPKDEFPFEVVNLTPGAVQGEWAVFEVRLGDSNDPAINLSGYAYQLDYNQNAVVDSTLEIQFYHKSWFSQNANTVNLFEKPWDGRLESGFARVGGSPSSGEGGVEIIVFIIEDNLDPFRRDDETLKIPFYFRNITKMDGDGIKSRLEDKTFVLEINKKKNHGELDLNKLLVFPNPAKDQIMVLLNGSNEMKSYSILGVDGRVISSNTIVQPKLENISLSNLGLADGIYLLRVETNLGPLVKKFIISN